MGLFTLPAQRLDRRNEAVVGALVEPEVVQGFAQLVLFLQAGSANAFGQWIEQESPKGGEMVKRSNILME